MADDAVRLKVDRSLYEQTLNSLETQLGTLKSHEGNLQDQINRLNSGNVFAGSDVKEALKKAEESLEAVRDGISRVTGYKVAIQQQLESTVKAKETLASDMASIDIPNMFE